jgi:septum formation protein
VVLASGSPRRRELLTNIGIVFDVVPADIDETERPGEDPVDYVRRLAIGKVSVGDFDEAELVIAADTTVDVDGAILAKPEDEADARRMLALMSGRAHDVHTGVAVRHRGRVEVTVATTKVTMVPMDAGMVDWYVATGEPFGKAGAYGIQGAASALVAAVDGNVTNVIGLPLSVLDEVVRRFDLSLVELAD